MPIQSRLGGMVRPSGRDVSRLGTTLVIENLHYNVTEEDLEVRTDADDDDDDDVYWLVWPYLK